MSRHPHLVALRAAQREDQKEISRSRVQRKEDADPRVLYQRAVGFAERQAFAEALECFEELLAKTPDNVHAHCAHARLLQTMGSHGAARSALLAALMVQPDQAEALGLLGRSARRLGDPEQARECFCRAIALVPRNAELHFDLGELLLDEGRIAEALEHFERATQIEPGFALAWAALGSGLERLGHPAEARGCFERARQLAPYNEQVARAWGRSLLATEGAREPTSRFQPLWRDPRTASVGLELTCSLLAEHDKFAELSELLGFDRLLASYEVDRVDGYASVRHFNEALLGVAHSMSEFDGPAGVRRSGNLLPRSKGVVQDFAQLIADAVTDYLAKLPGRGHPFADHRPMQHALDTRILSVPPGARESTESKASWLHGIYYAKVPERSAVTEFGILDTQGRLRESPKLICRPEPGLLLLYPSFWQRTSRVDPDAEELVMLEFTMAARTGATGARYAPR